MNISDNLSGKKILKVSACEKGKKNKNKLITNLFKFNTLLVVVVLITTDLL